MVIQKKLFLILAIYLLFNHLNSQKFWSKLKKYLFIYISYYCYNLYIYIKFYTFLLYFRENKLDDTITLRKGRLEDLNFNHKFDVIVSEWMGYFLLFEGMLDSVIYGRNHYLAPGGYLLPNRCTLHLVGVEDMGEK